VEFAGRAGMRALDDGGNATGGRRGIVL